MDPEQTAPIGAVSSGFTLYVYEASNILVDDNKHTFWADCMTKVYFSLD